MADLIFLFSTLLVFQLSRAVQQKYSSTTTSERNLRARRRKFEHNPPEPHRNTSDFLTAKAKGASAKFPKTHSAHRRLDAETIC